MRPATLHPDRSRQAWESLGEYVGAAAAEGPSPAHCEITSDGGVIMRLGTQDLGTGTPDAGGRRIAADALGLRPSQVGPEIGDTAFGVSALSGGSTTAASIESGDPRGCGQGAGCVEGKVAPALGVDAATLLVAAGGRSGGKRSIERNDLGRCL